MNIRIWSPATLVVLVCSVGMAAANDMAPVPTKVLEAKTVLLLSDTGDAKAMDVAYKALKEWGRYEVVANKSKADLVLVLTTNIDMHASTKILNLQLLDAGTGELLWTEGGVVNRYPASAAKRLIKNLRKRIEEQQKQE